MAHETHHSGYLISDDPARLDPNAIHAYLRRSYWAANIPLEIVEASVRHSLCLGVYTERGDQIGFVRLITDYATFGWLCDVYVLEEHRGKGLAKAALKMLFEHPRLQGLRRFALGTRDAHELYSQFGFTQLSTPRNQMERRKFNPYPAG